MTRRNDAELHGKVERVLDGDTIQVAVDAAKIPEIGWTTTGRVYRVIDGDTIQVEVSRTFTVRIRDCWAPETNREGEKKAGLAAKKYMQQLADGMMVRVYIPGTPDGDFRDVTSMGRVVGDVWLEGTKKNLAEEMVKAGHATAKKERKK